MSGTQPTRLLWWKRLGPLVVLALLFALCFRSYASEGVVFHVFRSDLTAEEKMEFLRRLLLEYQTFAWLIYLGMVIAEVLIAPLPGALLYAPGGMIFGGFWGGVLTLLGNTIGAGLATAISRRFARGRIETWQENPRFRQLLDRISGHGFGIIVALRINPVTSSDLVSYAAGFTKIPIRSVVAGTFVGMAPLCFLQAYFAHRLLKSFPSLLYPGLALCAAYIAIAAWLLLRSSAPQTLRENRPIAAEPESCES